MRSFLEAVRGAGAALGTLLIAVTTMPTLTHGQATVFADEIPTPSGIYVDEAGLLWVASRGTGNDDAGIYIVTQDGTVHPFITGLPSEIIMDEPGGTSHVYINNDTEVIVVQDGGSGDVSGSVFTVDTTGFTPGDAPLTPDAIGEVFPISPFVTTALGPPSNPHDITFVPNSDVAYVTDAAANALVKGEDGELSILTEFPDVANTGDQGPAMVDAVPTGLEYFDGTIFVATLTGFPFNEGAASILAVDSEGNISTYLDNLTTVTDLQVLPDGNGVVFIEHRFDLDAGRLYKYEDEQLVEVATGLDRPSGLRIGHNGEVYVSLYSKGQIVVVEGVVTALERGIPDRVRPLRSQAYPNPFSDAVNIAVVVSEPGPATLTIADVLGRTVYRQSYAHLPVGTQRFRWTASSSEPVSSGAYFYRIEVPGRVARGTVVMQ